MSDVKSGFGTKVGSFLSDWSSNMSNGGVSEGYASNPMFNTIGSMAGNLISSSGGDLNNAQGVATAISLAPDMFKAIKNFDASSWKAGLGSSMNIAGIAGNVLGAFADDRKSLSGEYGQLSKNAEMVADTVLSSIPGFGQAYAAINGVSDFLAGNEKLGLSSSGNTKSDAIMDAIPVLGLLNNLGKNPTVNELNYDTKAWNTVGSSYAGSLKSVKDASDNTGGSYGWLSTITGEYQKDLEQNREAERQQTLVSKISDEATENSQIATSTLQEATMNQLKKLQGLSFTFRVLKGMKLPTKEDIQKTKKLLEEPKITHQNYTMVYLVDDDITFVYKNGGKPEKKEEKPKTRSLEELIQYAKELNPRFVLRMTEPLKLLDLGDGNYATHLMAWEYTDDGLAMAFPTVMEDVEGNLYNYEDKSLTEALNRGDYLIMTPEEAEIFTTGYKQGWPMFFLQTQTSKFKEGGKMNIIPEGELHARLHHMELEGITKKGIPVISVEEGGEVIQHAEIERNEIIFHLELTKKLEQLMEDGSDEAAIEAGKLLVDEILNNTEDRTGLLNEVE